MSRPKRYETNAAKQRAYRLRKRANEEFPTIRDENLEKDWGKATLAAHHQKPTIEVLREMVANVSKEPPVEHAPTKPLIFRDDHGRVITERQWKTLEERKRRAKEGGYEIDDYSQ